MKKIINSIKRVFRILFRNVIVESNKLKCFDTNNTIMSFNVRADLPKDIEHNWNNRKEAILRMIADIKPAVICMQEVMPHMYKYLKENLSNIYRCTDLNVKWFDAGKVIFYDKKRYILNNFREVYFPTNEEDPKPKSYIDITLLNIHTHKYFKVLNTHLSVYSKKLRESSITTLCRELSKFNDFNKFLCGDFNCISTSTEFESLRLQYNITPNQERTFNHFDDTVAHLDYIISDRLITGYKVINKDYGVPYISDHYPIIIDF